MVIGVANTQRLIDKLGKASIVKVDEVLSEYTLRVQRNAKSLAPVDTGVLRSSIKGNAKDHEVKTKTKYAVHQEFGTSRMKAQPFMRPALKKEEKNLTKDIKKHITKELKKL